MTTTAIIKPPEGAQGVQATAYSEFNDTDYVREVLRLTDGKTEAFLEATFTSLAEELGIPLKRPLSSDGSGEQHATTCNSSATFTTDHARTGSTVSRHSSSTGITSRSSNEVAHDGKSDSTTAISFAEYEKLIHDAETQLLIHAGIAPPPIPTTKAAPSLFSVSTRKSYQSIKSNFKNRFMSKNRRMSMENLIQCVCCRDEFRGVTPLHSLPCGHAYCDTCIRILINQAATDQTKMPPRCCSRPIPASIAKVALSKEDQEIFIRSVQQYITPIAERIFCPNPTCGEFIAKVEKIDPKRPFEVVCRQCDSRACTTCKRAAHAFAQPCPKDVKRAESDRMDKQSGWRRCYECKSLTDAPHGRSFVKCDCNAQFCHICGAVWDLTLGCPNYCRGEEELERRRIEAEKRALELEKEQAIKAEADKRAAALKSEAEQRTLESYAMNEIRIRHFGERDRFCAFERRMKWIMWTRHAQARIELLDKYKELLAKLQERHLKTANVLEDRQVGAEMELRASLQQSEKSVRIRLRHMEAYCEGLGRATHGPARVITERDLRELGQQYNVRDDLERLHQSKINVMRDKQAKQMEQLLNRQQDEVDKLIAKQDAELATLEGLNAGEEGRFTELFKTRRERLQKRWEIDGEVERRRLEADSGLKFAAITLPDWPEDTERKDSVLDPVRE